MVFWLNVHVCLILSFLSCLISVFPLLILFSFHVSELYEGYFWLIYCTTVCVCMSLRCIPHMSEQVQSKHYIIEPLHNSAMPRPGFNTVFNRPLSTCPHDSEVHHLHHSCGCFYRGRECDGGQIFIKKTNKNTWKKYIFIHRVIGE